MNKVIYYVGIVPEDTHLLMDFISLLNEQPNENLHIKIESEFDDPDGYYSYTIKGTFDSYQRFSKTGFIKSLEHFEED